MKPFFGLISILLTIPSSLSLALSIPKDLDHSKSYETHDFIFIPRLNLNEGSVFYKTFEEVTLAPFRSAGGISKILVDLVPIATKGAELSEFLGSKWQDQKETALKTGELGCSINSELLPFFKDYPESIQPKIRGGGYPTFCTAVFSVPEDLEAIFLETLKTKKAISLNVEIPLCQIDSEIVDTKKFSEALQKTLYNEGKSKSASNGIEVELWQAAFEAARLISTQPDLIKCQNDKTAIDSFFTKFAFSADKKSIISTYFDLSQPTTICKPRLLKVTR